MKRLIFALPLAALLCCLSAAATAATIMGPLTAVTAIDNLLVDGTQVDVTFGNMGWMTAFPGNNPLYNGNSHGAEDAANAIALALTSAGATGIAGGQDIGGNSVFVPFSLPNSQNIVETWAFSNNGAMPTVWGGDGPGVPGHANQEPASISDSGNAGPNFLAVVTPQTSPVPEPTSVWLMLTGVAALRLFDRRRRAA